MEVRSTVGDPLAVALFDAAQVKERVAALKAAIERIIVGKSAVVDLAIVALMARGHLLIADVPGVGKTTLAQSLARAVGGSFQRIQFTNDLLPSDVLGVSVWDRQKSEFVFKPGPIFANVIVADEINRTSPKTQSCLLEAMSDGQVSVDNVTHRLPAPFMVLATQNPVEFAGTFPLPESQLDRFLMRVRMGYPSPEDEKRILTGKNPAEAATALAPVLTPSDVQALQAAVERVRVADPVAEHVVALVNRTRADDRFQLGISPRGSLALMRAAQALALVRGLDYVTPDEIKAVAIPVFAHRLVLSGKVSPRGTDVTLAETLLAELLESVPVPL